MEGIRDAESKPERATAGDKAEQTANNCYKY